MRAQTLQLEPNMTLRNLFLSLIIMLLAELGYAQKPGSVMPSGTSSVDYNVKDQKGRKQGLWYRQDSKSKMLYYKGQFKDNVPYGEFTFFYQDGEISSLINHVQDTIINDFTGFHPNGKTKMAEGRYLGSTMNGEWLRRKHGIWKFYDLSGVLRTEENYQHDKIHGVSRTYFGSGQLLGETTYINGIKDGPFLEWYENGQKKTEATYKNDVLEGNMAMYSDKGKREAEGSYINGLKHGRWVSYLPTGSVEMQLKYELGKEVTRRYENGTFMEYYPSSIPKHEYTYEQGKKDGPFTEWYDLGDLVKIPTTPEEQAMGIMERQKIENRKVKMEGNYLNDHLEGEIKYYDEKARMVRKEVWADGILRLGKWNTQARK